MVDNQHQLIAGYRDLDPAEIDHINKIKRLEEAVADAHQIVMDIDGTDKRWAAIAKTHLEQGFMALVRAVARPDSPFDNNR